jgi:hypothetical protein
MKWSLLVAALAVTQWFVASSTAEACWGCGRAGCYYTASPCCSSGYGLCGYGSYGYGSCGYGGYGSYGYGSCGYGLGGYGGCGLGGCDGGYSIGPVGLGTCCHDSVQLDIAVRQCRVAYFDPHYSVWVEADVMVPYYEAAVGLSTCALIPNVGYKRGWITQVFTIPNVGAPKFVP